ncbi:MAG TPA: hypothetical protein PLJ47_04315, partial [Candidatus Hydrogenedentes bacterium]|nr:hypothetical protein [Candidatus Hydrogenedentota bacterium]
ATEAPAVDPAAGGAEAAEGTPATAEPAEPAPSGDIVTLNNGHQYRGLQVLRSTASEVLLEVTETVTIKVPRRQIKSIEYDDVDPVKEREKAKAAKAAAETAGLTLLAGQKIPPELQKVLGTDISSILVSTDPRDLNDVIGDLNTQLGQVMEVDAPVMNLPSDQRQWTITPRPGMTLGMLLQDEFVKSFPNLAMVIRGGKLLLTDKESALKILETEGTGAPAAPEAPAP